MNNVKVRTKRQGQSHKGMYFVTSNVLSLLLRSEGYWR